MLFLGCAPHFGSLPNGHSKWQVTVHDSVWVASVWRRGSGTSNHRPLAILLEVLARSEEELVRQVPRVWAFGSWVRLFQP